MRATSFWTKYGQNEAVLKIVPVVQNLASKSFPENFAMAFKHLQTTIDNYVIGRMSSEAPSPLMSDTSKMNK